MTIDLVGGGQVKIEQDGMLARCQAERDDDKLGLYKVWLAGEGGRTLLGTLAPEGGKLRLCRRVSVDTLRRQGCWPVLGGECVLAFAFEGKKEWRCEPAEQRMTDPILRRCARGVSALIKREHDGFCVALPFDPSRPFALAPAFCFARVEQVEGRLRAVFSFDGQGQPRMAD